MSLKSDEPSLAREMAKKHKHGKETGKKDPWASSYFALIPFAVFWAYQTGDGEMNLLFFIGVAASWAVYALVFTLFRQIYESFNYEKPHPIKLVSHIAIAIFASICIAHLIYG